METLESNFVVPGFDAPLQRRLTNQLLALTVEHCNQLGYYDDEDDRACVRRNRL